MARKIIWTSRAEEVFHRILEFYLRRNETKTYSRKLNAEIKQIINLLKKFPFLGISIDIENIRVLIKSDFRIFYKIMPEEIVILLIWDCRHNPEDLKI